MILLLLVLSFLFMEFIAWSNHKYVMHGFLWSLHKDHHVATIAGKPGFQKNDLFFLIYAVPAIILIISGISFANSYLIAIGAGITLYGITYFLIHDVVIHHRLPLFKNPGNFYISAIIRAHEAHHKPRNVTDFKNYGLLIFPVRFFK
ncbi:MAG: sterol desaturase family protein [Bacteroidales bacterium]|nr:sterol desaturase family protein [Bacteroidales bacterium]